MEPCGFVRRKLRVSRTPQPLALYRHYPRGGAADDCRMITLHTRAVRLFGWGIRVRANAGFAIVALPAMAADRCFASYKVLIPRGMRPKYIRPACPTTDRDRRSGSVRIPGGGTCRYICHAGSANDGHGA